MKISKVPVLRHNLAPWEIDGDRRLCIDTWTSQIYKVRHSLANVQTLRAAGYTWGEIARIFNKALL
jgi:hypothetical protein